MRARFAPLLDAAAEVVAERGFAQARLSEIAERAGMKVGNLHRFFPSKQAVADALEARALANMQAHYALDRAQLARMSLDELAGFLVGASVALAEGTVQAVDLAVAQRLSGERWAAARAWATGPLAKLLTDRFPGLAADQAEAAAAVFFGHTRMMSEFVRDPRYAAAAAMLHQLAHTHLATLEALAHAAPRLDAGRLLRRDAPPGWDVTPDQNGSVKL